MLVGIVRAASDLAHETSIQYVGTYFARSPSSIVVWSTVFVNVILNVKYIDQFVH